MSIVELLIGAMDLFTIEEKLLNIPDPPKRIKTRLKTKKTIKNGRKFSLLRMGVLNHFRLFKKALQGYRLGFFKNKIKPASP